MLIDFSLFPLWWVQLVSFVFGIIIGSFLNVYIYRFHTGKSLAGSSHCLSCGRDLAWFELLPLVSYLCLRARCRRCGSRIPARYFLVELLTGSLFVAALGLTTDLLLLLLLWLVCAVLVVITVYDLYHFIIPDSLTIVLTLLSGLWLGYHFTPAVGWLGGVVWPVGAALLGVLFFLGLWTVSKGQWIGFGDVKLAFPLGILVSPTGVFSFVVLSFWIGAAVSLLMLLGQRLKRGKAGLRFASGALTMKSAVPFAPFLVASALVVLLLDFDVLSLFTV